MSEIETARLLLRPLDSGDRQPIAALFETPSVIRYLAVDPFADNAAAQEFAADFIRKSREEFASAGAGAMAVVTRAGALTIGYCGLRPLPGEATRMELLYALQPRYWDKGLAGEAARACLDWGFSALPVLEVMGLSMIENEASWRLMERLGMGYVGETEEYYGRRLAQYRLTRRQWLGGIAPNPRA